MPNDTRIKTVINKVPIKEMRRAYVRDPETNAIVTDETDVMIEGTDQKLRIPRMEMAEVTIGYENQAVHTTVELTDQEQAIKDAGIQERAAAKSGLDKIIASGNLTQVEADAFRNRLGI